MEKRYRIGWNKTKKNAKMKEVKAKDEKKLKT